MLATVLRDYTKRRRGARLLDAPDRTSSSRRRGTGAWTLEPTAVHPYFPAHYGCAKIGHAPPGQGAAAA